MTAPDDLVIFDRLGAATKYMLVSTGAAELIAEDGVDTSCLERAVRSIIAA